MTNTPSRVIVRAEAMLAILPFASTEETRYYLRGVFAEPHPLQGVTLVATDGHRLPLLHDPMAVALGLPQIWSRDILATLKPSLSQVRKTAKFITSPLWLDLQQKDGSGSAGTMRLLHAESAHQVLDGAGIEQITHNSDSLIVDGTFPDYRRVLPNGGAAEKTYPPECFQGRYLKDAAEFGAALAKCNKTNEGTNPMMIASCGPDHPSWIRFPESSEPEALHGAIVIMQIRETTIHPMKPPVWLNEIYNSRNGASSDKKEAA